MLTPLVTGAALVAAASLLTAPLAQDAFKQAPSALVEGEAVALAYSGFREGQHPDRGDGAVNPSRQETLEDLSILAAAGVGLVRLYDSGPNSTMILELIRDEKLPIKVMLGAWLRAEVSNPRGLRLVERADPRGGPRAEPTGERQRDRPPHPAGVALGCVCRRRVCRQRGVWSGTTLVARRSGDCPTSAPCARPSISR